jgi:hypothetical protein
MSAIPLRSVNSMRSTLSALVASLAAAACLSTGARPCRAVTAVSNLANTPYTRDTRDFVVYPPTYPSPHIAMSFTTGPARSHLNSVTVVCQVGAISSGPNQFTGWLDPDAGGVPGVPYGALATVTVGGGHSSPVTFRTVGLALQPLTTYWFELGYSGANVDTQWVPTVDPVESSEYGWTLGDNIFLSSIHGWAPLTVNANPPNAYPYRIGQMSLDVTFVPEPATGLPLAFASLLPPRRRRN